MTEYKEDVHRGTPATPVENFTTDTSTYAERAARELGTECGQVGCTADGRS